MKSGRRVAFDIVVLAASAGGIEAVSGVLHGLPESFPAAVLVIMHLQRQGSHVVEIFARHARLPVAFATDGGPILPGRIYVAPPQHAVEIDPDGTSVLVPCSSVAHPMDATLSALAESHGARALAVILTGMRNDGALGALAVKESGGAVLVQSPEGALHPSMPRAAIAAGAADLVLPLTDIGGAIDTIVTRGALPAPRERVAALADVFGGPGAMRAHYRAADWTKTALGPVETWPPDLRSVVKLLLASPLPMVARWGPEPIRIQNDAYARTLPSELRGPRSLDHDDLHALVRKTAEAFGEHDRPFMVERDGVVEERYFTVTVVPVSTARGVEGTLSTVIETTVHVLATRRMATLGKLAGAPHASSVNDAYRALVEAFEDNPHDVPFVLAYAIDTTHRQAVLKAHVRVDANTELAPHVVDLGSSRAAWPLADTTSSRAAAVVSDLATRFSASVLGPWGEAASEALLLPLLAETAESAPVLGVLVIGLNRRRPLDSAYRDFLDLAAAQIASGIIRAQAFEMSRARAHALAEANRAKTAFFSNVSHEFRTPLTLVLGHLDRALERRDQVSETVAADLELATRNARRLFALVTSLLDFAAAETHRLEPKLERVDLAAETERIAALFRPAAEQAGLAFVVECQPLASTVAVDPEMWAKVLVHLLSNALKFTFEGEVRVTLRERAQHAELVVGDTGVGIASGEQSYVFDRYFRGTPERARTHDGAGIGLAVAKELVRLHRGRIRVQSTVGRGTTFTVWLPLFGQYDTHVDPARRTGRDLHDRPAVSALAEAALAWTKRAAPPNEVTDASDAALRHTNPGARLLVVDDSADMRTYYERLFGELGWRVDAIDDGARALERMKAACPDIVIADVVRTTGGGFDLLRGVRADSQLAHVPVVIVTARADEGAAVEALTAGASDFIVKPFAPRELVARVAAQLEVARVRRRAAELNAFLVRFSDAVRGLTDPDAVARVACRMIVEALDAERSRWTEMTPSTGEPSTGGGAVAASHLGIPVFVEGKVKARLDVERSSPPRWTQEEIALAEGVAGRCWAEVERARVEDALRRSEERQGFLLALSDALRPLRSASEIQRVAARLLGEHLDADRAYYSTIDHARDVAVTEWEYVRGGAPCRAGERPLSALPRTIAAHRAGHAVVYTDVESDPRLSDAERASVRSIDVRSAIALPLLKDGELVAAMAVTKATPYEWPPSALRLLEETAERTWAAVERALAEQALRTSGSSIEPIDDLRPGGPNSGA